MGGLINNHMANKNTRSLRKRISRACRAKKSDVELLVPVRDWHNQDSPKFETKHFPTALVGQNGVNSMNSKRNTCQRVFINKGENNTSSSLTCHEALVKGHSMVPKNHNYVSYRNLNLT
jgi:hypothetical protein